MATSGMIMIGAVLAYLCLMLFVGYQFSKKTEDSTDFYLGGRKMGPIVVAMSAEASDMSSWLLMGLPGVAYLSGIADAGWTALGLALGTWLNFFFVARRLRRYSSQIGAITVPDFFSKRYHDKRYLLTALAAVLIVVFFVPYVASGFAACGKLFNTLFGVDYMLATTVATLIIIAYTLMGGFGAVATNDLIQSIVMSIALLIVVGYGVNVAGGFGAVMANASALPGYLSMTASHDPVSGGANSYGIITIVSTMAWGLGYFGMPHILVRFMSIEDEEKLKLSRRIGSSWVLIAMSVAVFIGIVGLGMTSAGALDLLEGSASETVIVRIAGLIAENGFFFAVIGGIIIAGILAATMSTADSQLLVASSSVSQNIIQDFLGKKMTEKQSLLAARISIVIISLLGLFLARDPNSSVFAIVSFAWAGFGGAFGAVMLCALFWKRSNWQGALAGMICGGGMVFIWKFLVRPLGGVWNIYELLPAFLISLAACVIVSLMTAAPSAQIEEEFERAK